jgi:glycosyltransferase involved in cell wall biosynthesis
MPAVSVILPFYNAAATLGETLDTIQAQTFTDFELIAVDDGSEDGSAELLAARAREDDRIRLFQPGRQGVVEAMNYGLAQAQAPLVARMDADDRMAPQRLGAQHACLQQRPELSLVGSRVRLFPEEAIGGGFREYIRWQNDCLAVADIAEEIYIELPIAHPSVMFRRQAVLAAGGYRDGDFPEDYELLLRLHHRGAAMAKLPEVLLEWRESAGRLTRTHSRYTREAFDRVRAAYLACDPRLRRDRPLAYWGAGRPTRKRAARLIEQGFPPSVWIDIDPRKIGNRLQGVAVVPPEWLEGRRPRPFVLVYVNNHGAREIIAEQLQAMGYRRGNDYLMVG